MEIARDHVAPDPHAQPLGKGAMGYSVHSLYFDTPGLLDFYQRLDERKVRNRLRVRTYGRPGQRQPVFLENKRKLEHWVIKHRVMVCNSDDWTSCTDQRPWNIFTKRISGQKRYAARHFVHLVDDSGRIPVSIVHYVREVFVARDPNQPKVRLTLDKFINATISPSPRDLYAPGDVDLVPRDWMVLELKFDGDRPGWMRVVCRELGLRAHPVSKFGLSVAKGVAGSRYREVRYLTPPPIRTMGGFA